MKKNLLVFIVTLFSVSNLLAQEDIAHDTMTARELTKELVDSVESKALNEEAMKELSENGNYVEAVQQLTGDDIVGAMIKGSGYETSVKTAGTVLKVFGKVIEAAASAADLYKQSKSLHVSDCVPNLEVNPSEVVPSSCGDNADCKDCYLKAYKEINFLRRQLARYNCYVNNVKKFADASITFGDKWSGVHPMAGIAWVSQKAGINKELDNLKGTIKKKNGIWLENLKKALMQVHECEAQNGQPDWYQRYGNLFFELIKEKYTRID
jgi:hypothetical protein